jgi:hypothetical protein
MLSLFKKRLPHGDKLYRKFLSPWYPEGDRPETPRPDLFVIAEFEGKPLSLDAIQYLPEGLLSNVKSVVKEMCNLVLHDHTFLGSFNSSGMVFLNALDKYYTTERVEELIRDSNPKEISNAYLVKVCELGAFLGSLFCESEKFGWLYSYPYFHSTIIEKESGIAIPVFDWAVKKFSRTGINEGLVAKFQAAHETIAKEKNNLHE